MYKGKDRELQFPHAVCVSYHNGDRGENGEVVRGYVACDLTDRTPKQVETLYRKRSAIETSYRTYREARANHHYTRPADLGLYSSLWAFCCGISGWSCAGRSSPAHDGAGATFQPNSRSNWCVAGSETI